MSNIFRHTAHSYFQVPDAVIESGVFAELCPSAQSLYVLLLHLSQKKSRTLIKLTASDAAKVGLSPRSVQAAREDLVKHKLIAATQERLGYTYEILDPVSGQSLEIIEDLARVDPEVVGEYFAEMLAAYDPQQIGDGLHAFCPFHVRSSEKAHPLHVTFERGGAFKCFRDNKLEKDGVASCKSGGIVDFAIMMAEKGGETLSKNQAYGRVIRTELAIMRKQKRQEAEELAERRAMM